MFSYFFLIYVSGIGFANLETFSKNTRDLAIRGYGIMSTDTQMFLTSLWHFASVLIAPGLWMRMTLRINRNAVYGSNLTLSRVNSALLPKSLKHQMFHEVRLRFMR